MYPGLAWEARLPCPVPPPLPSTRPPSPPIRPAPLRPAPCPSPRPGPPQPLPTGPQSHLLKSFTLEPEVRNSKHSLEGPAGGVTVASLGPSCTCVGIIKPIKLHRHI